MSINQNKARQYLDKRSSDAMISEDAHYKTGKFFSRLHYFIGITTIIFTGFIASGFYAELYESASGMGYIVLGALSVLATVLVALQTFLGLQEQAEKHRKTGSKYYAARTYISSVLLLDAIDSEEVERVRAELAEIASSAPNIPEFIWKNSVHKRTERSIGSERLDP